MKLGIENKVALITGAAGGIGAAIAHSIATEGARVVIADVALSAAETHAAFLAETGAEVMAVMLDVTDAASIAIAIEKVRARFGTVDILINNAGFTRDNRIINMSEGDWDAVIDVVLKGAFICTKAVLPEMIKREWGRIVNISSRAHLGNAGQANYSAAKAGLLGFTRAMALENGKYGVTVNAVAPGIIDTAAVRALRHFDKIKASAEATLPLARLGTAEDVAAAVTFLVSQPAAYITGDVLHVTGGRY